MKNITTVASNGSGSPQRSAQVTMYKDGLLGGSWPSKYTGSDGTCEFELDIGQYDKISAVAKSGGARGEWGPSYPEARIKVVIR